MSSGPHPLRIVSRALALAQSIFARKQVDSPALSAQLLLAETLGMGRMQVLLERNRALSPAEWKAFWQLAARRAKGEPVAYILGRKEFYGRDFSVNHHVLTPRPETEHMVEAVLARFAEHDSIRFADLGTGSGILAVTIALELSGSRGLAMDISAPALETARANAAALMQGGRNRLQFCLGDFVAPPLSSRSLDLVVSNPPYVGAVEYDTLSHEITRFEPRHALVPLQDEGRSGLESIACVLHAAERSLRPGGWLLIEIGCEQKDDVLRMAGNASWQEQEVLPDLAGLPRVFVARRRSS